MWIARDTDGRLHIFNRKPIYKDGNYEAVRGDTKTYVSKRKPCELEAGEAKRINFYKLIKLLAI